MGHELRGSHQLHIHNPPLKLYATIAISLFLVAAVLCIGNAMQPTVHFSEELDANQFQELQPVYSRRISLAQIAVKASSAMAVSVHAESKSASSALACKSRVPVRYAPYFACAMSGSSSSRQQHSSELFHEKELIAEAEDADNKETHALSEKLVKSLAESAGNAVSAASGSNGSGIKDDIERSSKSNQESSSNHFKKRSSSSSSSSSRSVTRSSGSAKSTVSVLK